MPHTFVKPARVTFHSTELATDVRRTYGYEARCACGWVGDVHRKHGDASWEARVHRHEQHQHAALPKREDVSTSGSAEAS